MPPRFASVLLMITNSRTALTRNATFSTSSAGEIRISQNYLQLILQDLVESSSYYWVVRADIDPTARQLAGGALLTGVGETSKELDIALNQTDFLKEKTYFFGLREAGTTGECIQYAFKIAENIVGYDIIEETNNNLSIDLTLSGGPITTTNKIVDLNSKTPTLGASSTDLEWASALQIYNYITNTGNGYLLASNNLSDLDNVNTAKTSLGLENVDNTPDLDKPVSNDTQASLNLKANIADLAIVATTGDYDDLNNLPTIPTLTSELTNDSDFTTNATLTAGLTTLDSSTVKLNGNQTIAGVKTFSSPVGVASPEADGDAVNRLYTSNIQPQIVTDTYNSWLTRTANDSYTVSANTFYQAEKLYKEIFEGTDNVLPDYIIHCSFSFDLSNPNSKAYNIGNLNQADGTLNDFTVDWSAGDPIDFRPDIAILDRNITLPTGEYEITDTDSITYNYWVTNNTITANDGYIFGNTVLAGQCTPRHSGTSLRVSRHDVEILGIFTYTPSTTTPTMLTFTYNPSTRLYRAYQDGVELFVSGASGTLGSAGELDGDGRLRLVVGKEFTTGDLKVGNNSSNTQSFNGKLYEGFVARDYVASPAEILALFNAQKTKFGL